VWSVRVVENAGFSMGHIYLSHSHPIAIYACPIPSHRIQIGMTFPRTSLGKWKHLFKMLR